MMLLYSSEIVSFFPISHLPWSRGQGLLQQWICTARTPKEWNAGGYTSSHSPTHPHLPRNPRTSPGLPRTAVQLYWVTKKMKPKLEYANSKGHRNNKWSIQENYIREEASQKLKAITLMTKKRANDWQFTNQTKKLSVLLSLTKETLLSYENVLNKPWAEKVKYAYVIRYQLFLLLHPFCSSCVLRKGQCRTCIAQKIACDYI